MSQSPFHDGNRMPIPADVIASHFLYKAQVPTLKTADVHSLVEHTKRKVDHLGLDAGGIDIYGSDERPEVQAAFKSVLRDLDLEPKHKHDAALLVCEWAPPHADPHHSGEAFLSVVLHTGPEPYIMHTFHTEIVDGQLNLKTSERILNTGDAFIFDPTTPHTVHPRRSGSDQLLVLFQFILDDSSPEKRAEIVSKFPPIEGDCDVQFWQ